MAVFVNWVRALLFWVCVRAVIFEHYGMSSGLAALNMRAPRQHDRSQQGAPVRDMDVQHMHCRDPSSGKHFHPSIYCGCSSRIVLGMPGVSPENASLTTLGGCPWEFKSPTSYYLVAN